MPSSVDIESQSESITAVHDEPEDFEKTNYRARAREFVELHDQVQTSVGLLDSLEGFLSTFQKDLSAVSGQISDLQDRSKDIDNRLKSRRKIEKPLSNLLVDLCIAPPLATIILDTNVGEPWIMAIKEFESRLEALKMRGRVKAARDMAEVVEGLRIVAATKLRTFFLSKLNPIRTSMTTNMQVIQTSVFLKYRPLFTFLQRQAAPVASEIQRAYIGAARTYFETGFRRYVRSITLVRSRGVEKADTIITGIGSGGASNNAGMEVDIERLKYARIDGPGPVLTYMADEKTHREPVEALLRSVLLVLMDNATAEYKFVTSFFATEIRPALAKKESEGSSSLLLTPPNGLSSPIRENFDDSKSVSDFGGNATSAWTPRQRLSSINSVMGIPPPLTSNQSGTGSPHPKEDQAALNAIWKQVMDPVLEYCQTFINTTLEPAPPLIPLLTMIRMTEDVMIEIQKRGCTPLETFIFTARIQMWPIFQKSMTEQVEALKKFADGSSGGMGGYFRAKTTTTDASVKAVCQRYAVVFNSFVFLTSEQEETMIFSNLLRLRQEVVKLITSHIDKMGDIMTKTTAQLAIYDSLLQGLSKGTHPASHPKAQSEVAFWKEREEETRRRMASAHSGR